MSKYFRNQPTSETYLVASGDQALKVAGNLYDPANNAIGTSTALAAGQLGVVAIESNASGVAKYDFIAAGDTPSVSNFPKIKIVQGTAGGADVTQFDVNSVHYDGPLFYGSDVINGRSPMQFVAKAFVAASNHSASFAVPTTYEDDSVYQVKIGFDGRSYDKRFGTRNYDVLNVEYKTPLYASTIDVDTDHFAKNVAFKINQNSAAYNGVSGVFGRYPVAAFLIDSAGTSTPGVDLSTLTAGTTFDWMVQNGTTYKYTVDAALANAITAMISDVTAVGTSSHMIPINLATAGVTGQSGDYILLVALDEANATVTAREPKKKIRLTTGFDGAFPSTTTVVKHTDPSVGSGTSRHIRIDYLNRGAAHQEWSQQWTGMIDNSIIADGRARMLDTASYNHYIIDSVEEKSIMSMHQELLFSRTHILIPTGSTATIETSTTGIEDVLGAWLTTVPNFEYVQKATQGWFDFTA